MIRRLFDDLLHSLSRFLNKRTSSARDSRTEEALARFRESDPQSNANSSPQEDDYIDLGCTWGIEFYTPAHIENLINGFRAMGWSADDDSHPNRDPVAWLNGLRGRQRGHAWMNLGILKPKDSDLFFHEDMHTVPLPGGVAYASAGIYSVTPSLVSVVVRFVFDDHGASRFDKVMRKNRQTYTVPIKGGIEYRDPNSQKGAEILEIRNRISRQIGCWFSDTLPGLFASGLLDREIPTCEFLTLRQSEPFPSAQQMQLSFHGYLGVLGLGNQFGVWQSKSIEGLKFTMSSWRARSLRYHAILAINEFRHISAMDDFHGSSHRASRLAHVDRVMTSLLCLWSILPMLEGYTEHLSKVRDSAIHASTARPAPANVLNTLGAHVGYSIDVAAVTAELAASVKSRFPLFHDVELFQPCDVEPDSRVLSLRENLEITIGEHATWLQKTDESLREHLTQYGSLVGAAQNFRMQARITFLTWALLILAAATLAANVLVFLMRDGTIKLPLF